MTIKLPPMPEMVQIDRHIPTNYVILGYTAEQMEAYAATRRAIVRAAAQMDKDGV